MSEFESYRCKHCGLPFPDDDVVRENCISRNTKTFPVCFRAPDESRWLIDCGMNGHAFVETARTREAGEG